MRCDICGYECRSQNDLHAHKFVAHKIEAGRVFICEICGLSELNFYGYLNHLRAHGLNKRALYDTFHRKEGEGRCTICGAPTEFAPRTNKWSYATMCKDHVRADRSRRRKATTLGRHGVDNVAKLTHVQAKMRETTRTRYGVEHALRSPDIRDRIRQTNMERYGVEHAGQSDTVKDSIKKTFAGKYEGGHPFSDPIVRQKAIDTCLAKYGVTNPMKAESIRGKSYRKSTIVANERINKRLSAYNLVLLDMSGDKKGRLVRLECTVCNKEFDSYVHNGITPSCPSCNPSGRSKGERELHKFIADELEADVIAGSRKIIAPYEVDLFVPSHNMCIEYDGLYWHSTLWNSDPKYHLKKTLAAEDSGLTMLHIFSDEWNNRRHIIESMLMSRLGRRTISLHARKCSVSKHDNSRFYDENHLQGRPTGKLYNYGLFFEDELVCSLSLSPSYIARGQGLELSRFATKLNTRVVGGFSKLLASVRRDFGGTTLYTFADRRYSCGEVYRKYGFDLVNVSRPGYYYTNGADMRYNRLAFMKNKIQRKLAMFDPALSEQENMANNGYYRVYDCGQYKFKIKL